MAKTRSRTKKETETEKRKYTAQEKTAVVVPCDDVVFEILARLPARSVGRFRCVSKSWLSIATNSAFVRAHIRHSRAARQALVFLRPGRGGRFFVASATNPPAGITLCKLVVPTTSFIMSSCDGLVCYNAAGQYNVFNPLTGTGRSVISLTEKSHQTCFLGFYFHHSTSEYRLLAAAEDETYVLVVGGNSWKQISCRLPAFCDHSYTADLNGCLHWLAWKQEPPNADGCYSAPPDIIMTFDTESEVYGLVSLQLPEKLADRSSNLLNFKGELGLWIADDFGIDLWVMEAECWVKKHSVNYEDASGSLPFLEAPPRLAWLIGVAVCIRDEELFVDISVSKRLHCLVLWNLNSGGYVARIWKTSFALVLTTFSHMESLFNPNHPF